MHLTNSGRRTNRLAMLLALVGAACGGSDTAVEPVVHSASLRIAVEGIPSGGAVAIQVNGRGIVTTVVGDTVLRGLAAGTYAVTASPAIVGGATYEALRPARSVVLVGGGSAAEVFAYTAPANANIRLTVSGLPVDRTTVVRFLDASGAERGRAAVGNGVTTVPMIPGIYKLDVSEAETATQRYGVQSDSTRLTILPDVVTSAPVLAFQPLAGTFVLALSSPVGVDAVVRLERMDGSLVASLTATAPVAYKVHAGQYVLRADTIRTDIGVVAPVNFRQPIAITVGDTTTAIVPYRVATPANFNLSITRVTVSQAVQPVSGIMPPIVAYRRALVRVYVAATEESLVFRPPVRIELSDVSGVYRTLVVPAVIAPPVAAILGVLGSTRNVVLDSADVRPGMRIRAILDPERTVSGAEYADNVWPAVGAQAIDARTVPPLIVTVVPIRTSSDQPGMTQAQAEAMFDVTRAILPVNTVRVTLHAPLTMADTNGFNITVALRALRLADGVSPLTYYVAAPIGFAGGQASVSNRIALSYVGESDLAHELGHLFGREHTPGCIASDEPYPYALGVTSGWGWSPDATQLVLPTRGDIMGYCQPKWVSDYTWTNVMNWRAANDTGVVFVGSNRGALFTPVAPRAPVTRAQMLLVFGGVQQGRATVSPAVEMDGVPSPVPVSSPYALVFRDRVGRVVYRVAVAVDVLADTDEGGGFAAMVPISGATLDAVTVIAVERNGVEVGRRIRRAPTTLLLDDGDGSTESFVVTKNASGRVIRWNAAQWPLAVVRDAATQQVLAFWRGGEQVLPGAETRAVDVSLSDGVRTTIRRIRSVGNTHFLVHRE